MADEPVSIAAGAGPAAGRSVAQTIAYILLLSWMANAGTAFLTLSPLLLGGMVDHLNVSAENAGLLTSIHLGGAAAGAFLCMILAARLGQRYLIVVATGCLLLGEVLFLFSGYVPAMFLGRTFAGFGAGLFAATAFANVVALERKDAVYAFLLLCQMIYGFAGSTLWPQVLEAVGYVGAMLSLPLLGLLTLPFLRTLPAKLTGTADGLRSRLVRPSMIAILALASLFVHYIANSASWVYLERIGVEGGLSVDQVASGLAVAMIFGVVGTGLAIVFGLLKTRFVQITVGIVGIMLATSMLLTPFDAQGYTVAVSLILMTMVFTIPFYQGFFADLENGEQMAMLAAGTINIGLTVGPLLGSQLVGQYGFSAMLWFCIVAFGVAQVLISLAIYGQRPS